MHRLSTLFPVFNAHMNVDCEVQKALSCFLTIFFLARLA